MLQAYQPPVPVSELAIRAGQTISSGVEGERTDLFQKG